MGGAEGGVELGQEEMEISIPPPQTLPLTTGAPLVVEENRFETGFDEEKRERLPSGEQREISDTLTPLADTLPPRKPHTLHRGSTTSSLRSTTSSGRREKLPPLLRTAPQHILRINVRGIAVLPNIHSNEISIRASLNRVKLREISTDDRSERERSKDDDEVSPNEPIWEGAPVIRARIEIGDQVERFDLPPSEESGNVHDIVAMLSICGLRAALLAKNVAVVKDFFDDELESETPVPIQIHVEDTTIEMREELSHTSESDGTTNVCVKSIDIYKGKKISGINLFSEGEFSESTDAVLTSEVDETLRLNPGQVAGLRDTSPAAQSSDSSMGTNSDLIQTFRSFVQAFEAHVNRHGGLKVQLNQPEHIAGLLQELQVSLSDEEKDGEKNPENPPTYSETLERYQDTTLLSRGHSTNPSPSQQRRQTLESPTAKSRAQELRKLRHDSQELARIQTENDDLISQLTHTKVLLAERSQDLDEVTSECKKAKDDLVTHKQVLENYQEHIERLLTENADLRMIVSSLEPHQ